MRFLFLLLSFANFSFFIKAQNTLSSTNKKAIDAYQNALKALQERNLETAYNEFEEAIERDKLFAEPYFHLGKLYEQNRQFGNAILNYEKAVNAQEKSSVTEIASQQLGQLYLKKGDYQKALVYLEKGQPSVTTSNQKRYLARLESCKFAIKSLENPLKISPVELPKTVNRFDSQYFPVLSADRETLIFTGQQDKDENLYQSVFKDSTWSVPISISDKINTLENEGTASISADGRTLVFTSCGGRRGFGSCDLFIAYKEGNDWSSPQNLGPNINSGEWESQPSLSADGRTLYFVSDRKGSIGKRDIWLSKLDSMNVWTKAQNLGNVINTSEDDLSPFIHANGKTLFFSSEGHVGMGGLDLFFTENQQNQWTKPVNLGFPLNTNEDQVAFFITSDSKKAYYSLERSQDDRVRRAKIVEITLPENFQQQFKSTYFLKGIVFDAKSKQKLSAEIELISLKTQEKVGLFKADAQTGNYTFVLENGGAYAVFVNKKGYFFKSMNFDFSEISGTDKVLDIPLEPIQKNSKEILNNIFFDTGKWELQEASRIELDKLTLLLNENKDLPIEISGHTDDVGKDAENLVLSQKRAKSVRDYLIQKGINPAMVKSEGYGKSKPILPNTSAENRKLNRRIEIKFL
ncbi:OmpA family protein [Arcicella rosea]|uniref:Outer membrane protein OmpA-like peptidoglycan-associated protein n=1 Tax=Arcicella rosea TaxID=502909 RepID=A0A841EHJ0_9BACT|nr:OmpA family protein [Arcicella rosea]MBB6003657.1 outer membrane protein OmpA-like peptidoglycan-associated protein [Arcicella rosea]